MQNMELSTWGGLTNLINSKVLTVQYTEMPDRYDIYAPEAATFLWHITLLRDAGPDVTDFETNYKPTANSALIPRVQNFKDLGDNIPIALVNIAANKTARVIDLEVPAGKRWEISAWDASGTNSGYYELIELFGTQTETMRDSMDSATGWAISSGPGTLTVDTVDKKEGTGSLKINATGGSGATAILTKTVSPTQNWASEAEIVLWAKASSLTNGPKIWIRVTQAATTYAFSQQALGLAWTDFHFDLSEITTFDKTAVSKIDIFVSKTANREFHFDALRTLTLGDSSEIDHFFSAANSPYNHIFPVPVSVPAGHRIVVSVTNKQASAGDFEAGMNGREVTL